MCKDDGKNKTIISHLLLTDFYFICLLYHKFMEIFICWRVGCQQYSKVRESTFSQKIRQTMSISPYQFICILFQHFLYNNRIIVILERASIPSIKSQLDNLWVPADSFHQLYKEHEDKQQHLCTNNKEKRNKGRIQRTEKKTRTHTLFKMGTSGEFFLRVKEVCTWKQEVGSIQRRQSWPQSYRKGIPQSMYRQGFLKTLCMPSSMEFARALQLSSSMACHILRTIGSVDSCADDCMKGYEGNSR